MPSCTEHFTHVCITHSMPSCTDRAFHAGLYHPLNAVLHRQSISCRSLSPTQCRPAQTEHFMQVFITHSMPSCTDRAFHAGLYHPLNAVLHRQSISCRSLSPTQCRPAQTEHFTQVFITHSMPSCTDRAFHAGLYHPLNAVLHRQSISCRSLSPTQCRPAQTEHFMQVFITHSMPSCTDRAFHAGLYHPLNAVLHRQSISRRSLSPTQCRPAQTEHFMQVCVTHSMPSCTDRAFHGVFITHSLPSCTASSFVTSTTQTEHFTHVFITHSMPTCTVSSFLTSTTQTEKFSLSTCLLRTSKLSTNQNGFYLHTH